MKVDRMEDQIIMVARKAIEQHFQPRVGVRGNLLVHDEPVDHLSVQMSTRLTKKILQQRSLVREVDGVPLVYVEKPVTGNFDLSVICQYFRVSANKVVGSRGCISRFPDLLFSEFDTDSTVC